MSVLFHLEVNFRFQPLGQVRVVLGEIDLNAMPPAMSYRKQLTSLIEPQKAFQQISVNLMLPTNMHLISEKERVQSTAPPAPLYLTLGDFSCFFMFMFIIPSQSAAPLSVKERMHGNSTRPEACASFAVLACSHGWKKAVQDGGASIM